MDRETAAGLIAAQLACCALQGVAIVPPVETALHQTYSPLETRLAQILTVWRGLRGQVLLELSGREAAPAPVPPSNTLDPAKGEDWPEILRNMRRLSDGKPMMEIADSEELTDSPGPRDTETGREQP